MTCVEKEFILGPRKCEEYKGSRFYNGDCSLVDDSGLPPMFHHNTRGKIKNREKSWFKFCMKKQLLVWCDDPRRIG
jgi:hypothetical protein